MEVLKQLDQAVLVDMLARFTRDYTRMLRERSTKKDLAMCKDLIDKIANEIQLRAKQKK